MILITGGAGSIGSLVTRRLVKEDRPVRVLDNNEERIWDLRCSLPNLDCVLGDVTCMDDVKRAAEGCESVIHCAAAKHVDLCELSSPFSHRTNVAGTKNVLAAFSGLRVVFLSTDKAIEPQCVMGRHKQIAERLTLAEGGSVVRFGNVIGTRGSLLPRVIRAVRMGSPITVTDDRMTRFFMSDREAADLILEALWAEAPGGVFGPVQPRAMRVLRFVEICRDLLAPKQPIRVIGSRAGERIHEPMTLRTGETIWSNDQRHQLADCEAVQLLMRTEIMQEAVA